MNLTKTGLCNCLSNSRLSNKDSPYYQIHVCTYTTLDITEYNISCVYLLFDGFKRKVVKGII